MKEYARGIVVRIVLTAALLVMVYRETGPWTTLALALITAGVEAAGFMLDRLLKEVRNAL
jgi:lipoprotein signal peptidase